LREVVGGEGGRGGGAGDVGNFQCMSPTEFQNVLSYKIYAKGPWWNSSQSVPSSHTHLSPLPKYM